MKRTTTLLLIGVLSLVLFALFSKAVRRGVMTRIDFDTTVKLQDKIPGRLDEVMDDGAILADAMVSLVAVIALSVWAMSSSRKNRLHPLIIIIGFLAVAMAELYGKTKLPHPGPPFFMVKHPTTILPKFTMMEPYSYPSGHASRITFIGLIFLFLLLPKLKSRAHQLLASGLVLGYIAFIYISRIYLGHHWLSDILGGLLLGGAVGVLTWALLAPYNRRTMSD